MNNFAIDEDTQFEIRIIESYYNEKLINNIVKTFKNTAIGLIFHLEINFCFRKTE